MLPGILVCVHDQHHDAGEQGAEGTFNPRTASELAASETATSVEHGAIVLSRVQGGYRDLLRRYVVLIDGVQAGRIARGQTLRFYVPSAVHHLQLKIDWLSSARLTALVEPGKTVAFVCSPGGDASVGLNAITVSDGGYIALWQTPEPIVMTETSVDRGTRLLLGAGLGFFGGGLTLIGAWVWHYTGGVSAADNVVTGVSLAVTITAAIVFRLSKKRRS